MIILGIETSCDETALALLETRTRGGHFEYRIIQSLVHSQAELHSAYGGVFPSLAKREHGKNLAPLLHKLLTESSIENGAFNSSSPSPAPSLGEQISRSVSSPREAPARRDLASAVDASKMPGNYFKSILDSFKGELSAKNPDLYDSLLNAEFLKYVPAIDRIAVTEGPGLEPALWVGINFARVLGALWRVPVIPVNHMEGHIVGSLLAEESSYGTWQKLKEAPLPAVALLISGGHTELVLIQGPTSSSLRLSEWNDLESRAYKILGQTKDDAAGEAFDKVARLLGLPYPGGPHISKLAHEAYEARIASPVKLPRPMIGSGDLDFSFAGLKTAVLYAVQKSQAAGLFDDAFKKGMAYEFEQAVADTLDAKLRKAVESTGARSIIVGGGVSANHALRMRFEKTALEFKIPVFMPSRHLSGDNALMIALAASLSDAETSRPLRAHGTKKLS